MGTTSKDRRIQLYWYGTAECQHHTASSAHKMCLVVASLRLLLLRTAENNAESAATLALAHTPG